MLSTLFTLSLAAAAAASPLRRATPALKVTVSTPADVEHADNLYAVVQLTNTGEDAVEINSFDTAFAPIDTNDFRVDGSAAGGQASEPAFIGAVARYVSDPAAVREAGGLIRLAPGESKSVNTTLAARYDFTQSGAGTYSIGTPAQFSVITGGATDFETVTATVEPATVNLRGSLVSKRDTGKLEERAARYLMCSFPQEAGIAAAIVSAQAGIVKVIASLPATSPAYTTWFGAYDLARANTVHGVYSKMNGLFDKLVYDCTTCQMVGVYAYVWTTSPENVFLCPAFWPAPTAGFDSKTDTLVHETSHWPHVGKTLDIVYTQRGSKDLAIKSPTQAIQNADNYAFYFADVTTKA